ncbi:MAG: histidine phosphatase family protein [Tsuneonella suprasediminis]|uniref:Histidine phosphatase family protein n=1 Tax=Tsuneonella suprasediminis TaxID=2306996 RepID=A0A419R472_9SPHN|nr:histidine phosphatase family protein [Tsuneonella suprasediminis]RJX69160.1 histidine phosphatase family protein [Tsuneonella suprasediminis]UBS34166.1 histidine phosphatase family protein [Altererythrobacter sp. N1]
MTDFSLHLLRHGAPVQPGLLMGRTDGLPTDAGIAARVAQAGSLDIEHIVTSDLLRCRAAADAIGATKGVVPVVDPRWRELDFGDWDGAAADTLDPEALGRFWDDPDASPPPGGERWSSLASRVSDALAALASRPTLIVTHGGSIRAALHNLCGFTQRQTWSFALPYGALVSLQVWSGDRPSAQITAIHA